MEFNTNKCKILTVTTKVNVINFQYKFESDWLKSTLKEKCFRVIINSKLLLLPRAKMTRNCANYEK